MQMAEGRKAELAKLKAQTSEDDIEAMQREFLQVGIACHLPPPTESSPADDRL